MNVYNAEDSGLSTGHYDISIISNDNDVFVFEMNEKEYKCEGLTFSYGGVSGDESQGRVNVYNQGSRPDRNLIYSDMSQAEFDGFIEWFASDFAKYDKLDGGMATYLVKDDTYKKYSIKNRIYCGSGATYMLSQVKGISDESSNRRALAFRLLKKGFENNILVVDSNVFRWLDRWFMTPVRR